MDFFVFNLLFAAVVLAGVGIHWTMIVQKVRAKEMEPLFGALFALPAVFLLMLIPLMWSI